MSDALQRHAMIRTDACAVLSDLARPLRGLKNGSSACAMHRDECEPDHEARRDANHGELGVGERALEADEL